MPSFVDHHHTAAPANILKSGAFRRQMAQMAGDEEHQLDDQLRPARRRRTMTSTDEIDDTITRPGSVKINVTGAFIVDPDVATPTTANGRVSPTHETSDIRLPNHTAVVSHIAVDVRSQAPFLPHSIRMRS
jgi:type II pantothenate kinase